MKFNYKRFFAALALVVLGIVGGQTALVTTGVVMFSDNLQQEIISDD